MTLPVAILAGGMATRLRPLTESIPKALVEVAGRPFIHHQLKLLLQRGFRRVVLCVGYLGEKIEAAVGDGGSLGMCIDYVFDGEKLLGTGGALRKALPFLGEKFMVLYGDTYLQCDYAAVEKAFVSKGKLGLMTVLRNANRWDRSNVLFSNGRIIRYDKMNPSVEMEHIDYCLGALQAQAFDLYPPDTMLDLATLYRDLLAKEALSGFEVSERFYEIGTLAGLEETRNYFKENSL